MVQGAKAIFSSDSSNSRCSGGWTLLLSRVSTGEAFAAGVDWAHLGRLALPARRSGRSGRSGEAPDGIASF
jgi:hypothetical protein